MSLRVNLLKEAEYRYQGPVSLRFAILISGSLVAAILLLVGVVAVQRYFSLRNSLRLAQKEWENIEDRYTDITEKQKELNGNQALLTELGKWARNRPVWGSILPEFQRMVPETVQLTRLGVRSDWIFLKAPAPVVKEGEEQKEQPMIPARKFSLMTEGLAQGELADETVVQFVRTMRENAVFTPYFESIKLQRLQRDSSQAGRENRQFEIQGEFALRKLE